MPTPDSDSNTCYRNESDCDRTFDSRRSSDAIESAASADASAGPQSFVRCARWSGATARTASLSVGAPSFGLALASDVWLGCETMHSTAAEPPNGSFDCVVADYCRRRIAAARHSSSSSGCTSNVSIEWNASLTGTDMASFRACSSPFVFVD